MELTPQPVQKLVQTPGEETGLYVPRGKRAFPFVPVRIVFALLSSVGFAIIYGLKVDLSVCIVAMVNHTGLELARESSDANATHHVSSAKEDGPFMWTETERGLLLGSYFWGYLVSEFPGGRLAEVYSAKWVMFVSVLLNVVATLLSPPFSFLSMYALLVLRIIKGIGGGMTFPAMHVLIAHWSLPEERTLITGIIYAGTALGTVISLALSGVIASEWGWEWVFYFMGISSSIWLVLWWWLVSDTPEMNTFITDEEQKRFQDVHDQEGHHDTNRSVPWKAIFTSLPFWAILIAHCFGNIGWYMLLTQLPHYMKEVLNFDIKSNALSSALPYLSMWLFTILLGHLLGTSARSGVITTTGQRKIATTFAAVGGSLFLVLVPYAPDSTIAVVFLVLAVTFMGSMFVAYLANHIDIAHNYAGTLMAITNTVATIPGIMMPFVVGYLTDEYPGIETWKFIFFGTAAGNIFYFVFYMIFGTAERQPWDMN